MSTAPEQGARPARGTSWTAAVVRRALRWRLVRAGLLYATRRGPVLADAVTYRTLFSVFAALLLGFSTAALWLSRDDALWEAAVAALDAALPGIVDSGNGEGIVDLDAIRAPAGLSIAGVVSLVGLIGSALGAIGSLRTAIRSIAGTEAEQAPWYRMLLRNVLLAVTIATTFAGAAVLTFTGGVIVRSVSGWLGLPPDSAIVFWTVRVLSLVAVLVLDAVLVAAAFRMLSGLRPSSRALWTGAASGAVALVVLQELSGLFVGGARANPLLASFASLLALLLWLNLSAQVILLASALIVTSDADERDRVAARFGSQTLAEHALRLAEDEARSAAARVRAAQDAVAERRVRD